MYYTKSETRRMVSTFLKRLAWKANPRPVNGFGAARLSFAFLKVWQAKFMATKRELIAEDICINP